MKRVILVLATILVASSTIHAIYLQGEFKNSPFLVGIEQYKTILSIPKEERDRYSLYVNALDNIYKLDLRIKRGEDNLVEERNNKVEQYNTYMEFIGPIYELPRTLNKL